MNSLIKNMKISKKIKRILEQNYGVFLADADAVIVSLPLSKYPNYSISYEIANITSDYSLFQALSYEISTFNFDRVEIVYHSDNIDIDISDLSAEFKKLYEILCHLTNEVAKCVEGAEASSLIPTGKLGGFRL